MDIKIVRRQRKRGQNLPSGQLKNLVKALLKLQAQVKRETKGF